MWNDNDKRINMMCDRCGKEFKESFATQIRMDYVEPGKGKMYEWHVCLECRKDIIKLFKWK